MNVTSPSSLVSFNRNTAAALLAGLLAIASSRTAEARADIVHTSQGSVAHVAKNLTFVLDPSLDALAPSAKQAISAGLRTWRESGEAVPSVDITESSKPGTAENDGVFRVLAMNVTDPEHAGDLAYTRVYTNARTGEITEADVIFNSNFLFASSETGLRSDSYDLTSVAAHEMGHVLGLAEDEESGSTMFKYTSPCDVSKRVLAEPDRDAIREIYATKLDAANTETTSADVPDALLASAGGCSTSGTNAGQGFTQACVMIGSLLLAKKCRSSRIRSH